ncbi:MAG TPA: type II toxin-antitoxin system PrlF family antitoxin [Terriglobales bacterium]|jgi:AbrB family looped-hinge helix DNA binding protein
MAAKLTSKGQVTIPKHVRDALGLTPGSSIEFTVNAAGEVVVVRAGAWGPGKQDRFERALGRADIPWRTNQLQPSTK